MEIHAPRRAAEIGFMAMRKFWARQNATSAAKIVFSAMVRNAALSGLENLVLSDADYQQVDATIFRFARKVLRGAACKKVVLRMDTQNTTPSLTVMLANFCHSYRPSWSFACGDYSFGKVWREILFCIDKCLQLFLDNSGTMNLQQCWVTACGCECVGKTIGD